MKRNLLIWSAAATVMLSLACDNAVEGPGPQAVYEVEVAGERFRVALTGAAEIARAEELLASGATHNLHGSLVRGMAASMRRIHGTWTR